jgi:hypothetical protein
MPGAGEALMQYLWTVGMRIAIVAHDLHFSCDAADADLHHAPASRFRAVHNSSRPRVGTS